MADIERAIKYFENVRDGAMVVLDSFGHQPNENPTLYERRKLNAELAISALEKQIPKKPTHEATLYKNLTCPNCKNVIDEFTEFAGIRVRVTVANCKFCGQALDWSEEE